MAVEARNGKGKRLRGRKKDEVREKVRVREG